MRFLLIDRITRWEPGRRATAIKNVALSEDFFEDHFPLRPVMPGVLILEGMAQLGGTLLGEGVLRSTGRRVKALLSIIEKAKFRRLVRPGDQLTYDAEVLSVNESGGRVAAHALVDGAPAADATLVFSFHESDDAALEARRNEILSLWLQDLTTDASE